MEIQMRNLRARKKRRKKKKRKKRRSLSTEKKSRQRHGWLPTLSPSRKSTRPMLAPLSSPQLR